MKKLFKNKKVLVAAALATILAIGGASYAWFTNVQTVAGGNLGMGIIEVVVSDLVEYKLDPADPFAGIQAIPFTGDANYMPESDVTLGYTVDLAGNSEGAIVYLDLGTSAMVNFATSDWSYGGNAIWAGPDNALPSLSYDDPDILAKGGGTISITPLLSDLKSDMVNATVQYYYDAAANMLFAQIEPGSDTTEIKFNINFSPDLDNTFQNCTVSLDAVKVLAAQTSLDNVAIDNLLAQNGIDYSYNDNILPGGNLVLVY